MAFAVFCLLSCFAALVAGYDTECYPDLGCFTNAPPWGNTEERPIDNLPSDPSKVDTRFYLDTRRQGDYEIYYNNMGGIGSSTLDCTKPIRLIIHGYLDGNDDKWVKEMSDALLANEDQNVIRVNWKGASLSLNYDESVKNAEVAGTATGILVNNMINAFGIVPSQIHCIGHSIGAHICAYVGDDVHGLARISGLDPAGKYYQYADAAVRLDPSDAEFVDVIHTDTLERKSYGTPQPSGHVDFWPNDGIAQPGCDQNFIVDIIGIVTPGQFVECNHMRAVRLYTESIITTCPFNAYPCSDYNDFLAGKCTTCENSRCPQMGYHAVDYKEEVSNTGAYSLTNGDSPYCEYLTFVTVNLGEGTKTVDGYLYVTLVGGGLQSEEQQIGENIEHELRPDGSYEALVYFDTDPGEITSVIFRWKQKEIELGRQTVTVKDVTVWKGASQNSYKFCGDVTYDLKEKTDYMVPACW